MCVLTVEGFAHSLKVPDLWQQEAVRHLNQGRDVVVHAPTGSGKTYIFELFVTQGFKRQAIYTVPTRALANDKLYEWRAKGWNVGIATGDIADKLDAPIVVATLETQKGKLLKGQGPGLLVIDEYQMLADSQRGINYELAIALTPPGTQLLLLSGSVANPQRVVSWLESIGREVALVNHAERPVPLDEVQVEALPTHAAKSVSGKWPKWIARALASDLGPILVFAPQRKVAQELANRLSQSLPTADWLELTSEQKQLAGDPLAKLLRNRIAFHHSGLSYPQRAGLIEPLAKAGQLRVIVATTGLAAGINFSMRSVMVTEREYQHGGKSHQVRPDELLQMFGRAGRRGLDEKGYILVAPGKPRLNEARPAQLRRASKVDWPSLIAVMHQANLAGDNPAQAARDLVARLFAENRVSLGLDRIKPARKPTATTNTASAEAAKVKKIKEMRNAKGQWERLRGPVKCVLGNAQVYLDGRWQPALHTPKTLEGIPFGTLCKLKGEQGRGYGRVVPLATLPEKNGETSVALVRWFLRALRSFYDKHRPDNEPPTRYGTLEALTDELLPLMPYLTQGGRVVSVEESNETISARLSYADAAVYARKDSEGNFLLNPPIREVEPPPFPSFAELAGADTETARRTPAEIWHQLGLMDDRHRPTRRGVLFSFFNHGEGLAIAAALEDETYDLDDLLWDIANLRAGHRFNDLEIAGSRLGSVCRMTYRGVSATGYLDQGLPPDYGDGAAEVLRILQVQPQRQTEFTTAELDSGDIERARLEWKSLLNHVAFAPDYEWIRWLEFKEMARQHVISYFQVAKPVSIPELTHSQRQRYHCLLRT